MEILWLQVQKSRPQTSSTRFIISTPRSPRASAGPVKHCQTSLGVGTSLSRFALGHPQRASSLSSRSQGGYSASTRSWQTHKRTRAVCPHCCCSVAKARPALCKPVGGGPPGALCSQDCPGESTGVGCHSLLQESSQIKQWSRISCSGRQTLYCQAHQGSPVWARTPVL